MRQDLNQGIFLLLGSNEGGPVARLAEAVKAIGRDAGDIVVRSAVYRTAAWGLAAQANFYNQVLEVRSVYSPERLLEKLLAIEEDMGRVRGKKWGPRIIDIDILFYGREIRDSPSLKIPHPGIPERKFTLVPLAEIAPQLTHPLSGKSIATLLRECTDTLSVEKLSL